ncbi:MAG: hypothetical protein V3T07_06200 [Myxococcota bacterium]
MNAKSFVLASAAAALFVAGGAGTAVAEEEGEAAKIHCEGVNGCKGQGGCKTATNDCKGQNGCQGKGFLELSKEECEQAKAKAEETG